MSTSPTLSIVATKKVIDVSWRVMLLCVGPFYSEAMDLVKAEEAVERRNRRGRERFPIPVNCTARMFAIQNVCKAPIGPVEWSDVSAYAPRIIAAYGLAARMRKAPSGTLGETYFTRMISGITRAIAEGMSGDDRQLLQARRITCGIADHLPLVCALDYSSDIVRALDYSSDIVRGK